MHSVGRDHEVESLGLGAVEPHVDAAVVLFERDDRVVEAMLDAPRGRVEEHAGELASHDLEIGHGPVAAEQLHADHGEDAVVVVDVAHAALGELRLLDPREQAHAGGGLARGAAQVDELAARAQRGGDLDDGDVVAAVGEHVCERETGDAGTRDQDLHDSSSSGDRAAATRAMVRAYETYV